MIDYHCHLLPGLDDGAKTVEEAVVMARALADFGFRHVCCTPHCIRGHYEFSPERIIAAVELLQGALYRAAVPLTLHPGMEYYLDSGFSQVSGTLLPLGSSRLILCEAPPRVYPELIVELLGLIVERGFVPLLAHPERSDVIWDLLGSAGEGGSQEDREPAAVSSLWRRFTRVRRPAAKQVTIPGSRELPAATLFQANLGSFIGYYGPQPQLRGYQLLKRGIYACLASDLHEGLTAGNFLQMVQDKVSVNPLLQRLAGADLLVD